MTKEEATKELEEIWRKGLRYIDYSEARYILWDIAMLLDKIKDKTNFLNRT